MHTNPSILKEMLHIKCISLPVLAGVLLVVVVVKMVVMTPMVQRLRSFPGQLSEKIYTKHNMQIHPMNMLYRGFMYVSRKINTKEYSVYCRGLPSKSEARNSIQGFYGKCNHHIRFNKFENFGDTWDIVQSCNDVK